MDVEQINKNQNDRFVIKLINCEGLRNASFLPYVYRIVYSSGFSRETESIEYIQIYVDTIYISIWDLLQELAHVIMEAKKSHKCHLQAANEESWWLTQSKFRGLRPSGADVIFPSLRLPLVQALGPEGLGCRVPISS